MARLTRKPEGREDLKNVESRGGERLGMDESKQVGDRHVIQKSPLTWHVKKSLFLHQSANTYLLDMCHKDMCLSKNRLREKEDSFEFEIYSTRLKGE